MSDGFTRATTAKASPDLEPLLINHGDDGSPVGPHRSPVDPSHGNPVGPSRGILCRYIFAVGMILATSITGVLIAFYFPVNLTEEDEEAFTPEQGYSFVFWIMEVIVTGISFVAFSLAAFRLLGPYRRSQDSTPVQRGAWDLSYVPFAFFAIFHVSAEAFDLYCYIENRKVMMSILTALKAPVILLEAIIVSILLFRKKNNITSSYWEASAALCVAAVGLLYNLQSIFVFLRICKLMSLTKKHSILCYAIIMTH